MSASKNSNIIFALAVKTLIPDHGLEMVVDDP
jgi:hypothetical protein